MKCFFFPQEHNAECNDLENAMDPGQTGSTRNLDQGEPRPGEELLSFNRVDVMRSLENQVNQELNEKHPKDR